jgi:hypothetical protein
MSLFAELYPDCSSRSAGDNCRTFYPPAPFGVLTAHKMAAAAASPVDFTGSGDFNSFFQTLVGFLFWHLISSLKYKGLNLQYLRLLVNLEIYEKMGNRLTIFSRFSPFYPDNRLFRHDQ